MFQANLGRGPPLGAKRQNPGVLGDKISKKPSVKQKVKPFTKESLERLENKTVQLVRDYGFQPRRKFSVEDGSVLPNKFEPFPTNLYGRPLEEIDNFIYDETFCVVSKRFRKNYIHRFAATPSFFIFSPWNPVRQTCIFLSTNQYFDYMVMATILLNCVFLAMTEPVEEAEFVFLAIYTAETIIKSVAKGFIVNKYTYLRNPWNWLDFIVITSGYATIGMEMGNLAGLKTFRVLRALKTVSIMPGLKTIINALLHSFRQLAEVMTLTIFCLMVFALFALQVYMGELRNKCIKINSENITAAEWLKSVWNDENWLKNEDYKPIVCGNATGARHCPSGYTCLRIGENPNYGYTNFDNFLWSMLTTFQLITLDYWENVYNMIISASGPVSVVFFTIVVFFGSFYLINLMLAVVALSYEEEAEITQEERRKDLVDHRYDSTFSFDPSNLEVKQLDKNYKKKIDTKKGILLSSYSRKKTKRRRRRGKEATTDNNQLKAKTETQNQMSSNVYSTNEKKNEITTISEKSNLPTKPESPGSEQTPKKKILRHYPSALSLDSQKQENVDGNHKKETLDTCTLKQSSLDDLKVLDDHEKDINTEKKESVTIAVRTREKEIRILKCNGVNPGQDPKKLLKERLYSLPPDYFSHIVVLEDLVDRNCESCATCCIDYDGWLRFQNFLYKLVKDPLFELLITVCIVLNTMFLAMEHHGMSESVRQALDIGNKIFTSIFTLECFLKLLALSKEFFECGWNIFDLIIVSASLLDLSIEILDGLTVLRGLRLLRVLKLAQSWTTMKVLLSIIISTIGALGNLTFVLVIVIYIFAVIGMQLFSRDYTFEKFAPDPVPRWNFNDFFHSFMMIFRILCGEWIEPLWDCMRAEAVEGGAKTCFFIFLPALVMGNFMVLNLFLALLLNSFNSEELKNKKEEVGEESKLTKSFERIRSIVGKKKKKQKSVTEIKEKKFEKTIEEPVKKKKTELKAFEEEERLQSNDVNLTEDSSFCVSFLQPETYHTSPVYDENIEISPSKDGLFTTSQEFSDQLREMFNEKIRSLHSSEDDILIRSPSTEKVFIKKNKIFYNPRCKTCFTFSPNIPSSPESKFYSSFVFCETNHQHTSVSHLNLNGHSSLTCPSYESDNKNHCCQDYDSQNQSLKRKIFFNAEKNDDSLNIKSKQNGFCDSNSSCSNVINFHHKTMFLQNNENNIDFSNETSYQSSVPASILKSEKLSEKVMGTNNRSEYPQEKCQTENNKLQGLENFENSKETLSLAGSRNHYIQSVNKRLSYLLAIEQSEAKNLSASKNETEIEKQSKATQRMKKTMTEKEEVVIRETGKKPWHTLVSYVDELTVGRLRDSRNNYMDGIGKFPGFGRKNKNKNPQDCFPRHCYQRFICCNHCMKTNLGRKWTQIRKSVLSVVDTPAFEWLILILIFSSSITLCFEDIYLDNNQVLKNILYWTNFGFCALFSIEMLLKWIALGFWRYFTSFWTILDFIIVFVSVFSLLIEENENLKVLRSLRTLRALRPLRAISRWQGMRIVVNALMYAIPSIFNVLLVCLVFWLIFSIMGVQFFGGKFFKCVDEDGELLPISVVNDKFECLYKNYSWINSKITFDHVGQAYLALFQVATFEGWMEVMADAVDARGENLQPQREANLYAYLYFVIFIVCGSFFTLNLFIGVIIDNFNMLKKKYEGGVLEMFLTESQKHYYTAMKKLGRKKPQKVIHRPLNQFLAVFYDLSNSRRFEVAIFILIFLNMVTMAIEHYDQPHTIFFILEVSNAFFTTVFGLEALVKIIGLRHHYFIVPWNVFDFLLVLASIFGILMEDIMIDFPISPTLLRVVRVFRIGRILRLIKAAKGIRKLLFALVVSLPALFNIGALLSLITFIYAIIGMSVFGHVKQQGALDDIVNFETFGRSMQLLFRLMTSAGWNDVLESLMIQPPDCNPQKHSSPNGDCGYPLLAITYFTSFIIINYMIVINMYIAIILENFNQAHQEEEIGIVEDDLEMFYIRWSKYDPHATQFIRFNQLSDFIASLDPPLGISKPNIVALVSFNLPIARGNKIHCLDILHALVKHVLGHVEETDDFKKLQDQMDVKFKKQFPTRKELEIISSTRIWKMQDKAARLIQKTYLDYVKRKKEKESEAIYLEDEVTQTSSPGGWQSKLSALLHVHRGSRASSRKSSRASEASDISELGGPWLNLPLLLLGGTNISQQENQEVKGDISITVSEASPEQPQTDNNNRGENQFPILSPHPISRRRSFNVFQRKGSAKERKGGSPTPGFLRRLSFKERSWLSRDNLLRENDKEKSRFSKTSEKATLITSNERTINKISKLNENNVSKKINILLTKPSIQSPTNEQQNSEIFNGSSYLRTNEVNLTAEEENENRQNISREGNKNLEMEMNSNVVHHVLVHRECEEYSLEDQGS